MRRCPFLLIALVVLAGCRVQEFVVQRDRAPFYEDAGLTRVVDRLPLAAHDRVEAKPDGEALAIRYRGRDGWVRASDVALVSYLDPSLDEGVERAQTLGRAVREAQVGESGRSWPPDVQDAVIAGRVLAGMTREQVEVSWGWPDALERLEGGVERWIYRRPAEERITVLGPGWSSAYGSCWHHGWGPGYRWRAGSVTEVLRFPLVEERTVELVEGRVRTTSQRHFRPEAADLAPE